MTKNDFERELNELGPPEREHPDNGGRLTWAGVRKYGTWLRRNDPIAFNVGYQEQQR